MADDHILTVDIITPEGIVYHHHGKRLIVRASDGDLGILPNHIPIIATLKIAEVRVLRADDENHEDAIAVNGGYLEFTDNVASIVANSAERARDIDLRRARYARQKAQERLEHAQTEHDANETKRAQVALARAINRINVSGHR
ncbi:F0F1 ATP synthase subunit epsilon [Bombilactobacillus thymidiniphilus]|uniref:ATP synthase epsilon chain n=1 Tax=Bombilactobacillus thymidiniphilus TaxID=2923363 RepID=A0ABY4PDM9_9LACO|nr:F0F1 ATP synthase subunit epsilon [Bombilactobacillus thymidiniphilus]UQS83840.1 F0F1 ATP synthase subunit epsilon [Bombilactobacillus thymidiniphilus]